MSPALLLLLAATAATASPQRNQPRQACRLAGPARQFLDLLPPDATDEEADSLVQSFKVGWCTLPVS